MRKSETRRYTSARERAEKHSSGFTSTSLKIPDGVQIFQPKAGVMLIDILPFEAGKGNPWAEEGNLHWERTYYAHRGIGANGDTFICPRMVAKERCPICEARMKMMKESDEDNEELIRDLSPKQRQLFNVINVKDPGKGVQLWDISYHLFGKVLDARLRNSDEEDEWDKFFFLENGLTLKLGFAEKSFGGHAYLEVETIDFKQRKEDYDDDILEKVQCLDELLIVPEYEKLKKSFLEARGDDDDEDEDEKSRKHKRDEDEDEDDDKPRKRGVSDEPRGRKAVPDDADDDEDEDEAPPKKKKSPPEDKDDWDDFDEDEDEKPKKKPKSDDEDEDDDEDEKPKSRSKHADGDDEDEDDEPPKKKKHFRDEDEDEDEKPRVKSKTQEDEEDEEEDERPKKKSSKKTDDDDDWDDLDKDDDDEDEKPKKKSKKDDEDDD